MLTKMLEQLQSFALKGSEPVDSKTWTKLEELILGNATSQAQTSCANQCGAMYCSEHCLQLSVSKGHEWLCEHYQTELPTSQQLRSIDSRGHYGQACKVYANIAAVCLHNITTASNNSRNSSSSSNSSSGGETEKVEKEEVEKEVQEEEEDVAGEAMRVAEALLRGYHFEDYARTMHAHRTGSLEEIDPGMFARIIFPAYFSAQLATPLALCQETFRQSGAVLWGNDANGRKRAAAFLTSPIFSEQFYSRIIGTFVVNCLSVHVASPLDNVLSAAQHHARMLQLSGELSSVTADSKAATSEREAEAEVRCWQQVVGLLERYRDSQQQQQQPSGEEVSVRDGGASSAGEAGKGGAGQLQRRFAGMTGSGLFPVFSKTNHSCLCNTAMHGGRRYCFDTIVSPCILISVCGHKPSTLV